jgi:HPt (histidine-containing phosphotransfer) domain-containing protein
MFFDQAGDLMETEKRYCLGGDQEEWREAVHKLKGSSGNLGADPLFPRSTAADKLQVLDIRYNDWSTSDAATIASWMNVWDYEVEYIPFIDQPVAVDDKNWGSLKSMFR